MSTTHDTHPKAAAEMPAVPLTLEGYAVLHQMMRFRRAEWRKLSAADQLAIADEAEALFGRREKSEDGQSAIFTLLVITYMITNASRRELDVDARLGLPSRPRSGCVA